MGVCVQQITCLSMDAENEKFQSDKVCVDDTITIFFCDGFTYQGLSSFQGKVIEISSYFSNITLEDRDNHGQLTTFPLSIIESFNRDFRGTTSKMFF